ncbi:hypothetical protein BTUL_0238g00010 [Botrytis tulipae]|uniref:J domain-containing protein n=1 Tax=Botrytis tulipae TaxID=87230 RepID=A0A4Z1E9H3_9HELO|nr:hypothetical protein BTUL_0238g00010 [Botrytis tulipae]
MSRPTLPPNQRTPNIRHHDCTVTQDCSPHFFNLALPYLPQWPASIHSRGDSLSLGAKSYDPPSPNSTLIKSHYRTLSRVLHPDKYALYIKDCEIPRGISRKHRTTVSPAKCLELLKISYKTLISPRERRTYTEKCSGLIPRVNMLIKNEHWDRAKDSKNPFLRNGWADVEEREKKGWGRKPWFWEYEHGLGQTSPLLFRDKPSMYESFWIRFLPMEIGKKWGVIDGTRKERGKVGAYGGDESGVGVEETFVNLGHYYLDNFLPDEVMNWVWERCENFRLYRGFGLTGHYATISSQNQKKNVWHGPHGEWHAIREGSDIFGSPYMDEVFYRPGGAFEATSIGDHCEGRVWWVWIPACAGGSVSELGIGRLAGSGVDSLSGKNLTELPWSHRLHNTDKPRLQNGEVNTDEVFNKEVLASLDSILWGMYLLGVLLVMIWGLKRVMRWSKSEIEKRKMVDGNIERDGDENEDEDVSGNGKDWNWSEGEDESDGIMSSRSV